MGERTCMRERQSGQQWWKGRERERERERESAHSQHYARATLLHVRLLVSSAHPSTSSAGPCLSSSSSSSLSLRTSSTFKRSRVYHYLLQTLRNTCVPRVFKTFQRFISVYNLHYSLIPLSFSLSRSPSLLLCPLPAPFPSPPPPTITLPCRVDGFSCSVAPV